MKMEQTVFRNVDSVPKRRHIKFTRRGITQKKAYNIQNTAEVSNQVFYLYWGNFSENSYLTLLHYSVQTV